MARAIQDPGAQVAGTCGPRHRGVFKWFGKSHSIFVTGEDPAGEIRGRFFKSLQLQPPGFVGSLFGSQAGVASLEIR